MVTERKGCSRIIANECGFTFSLYVVQILADIVSGDHPFLAVHPNPDPLPISRGEKEPFGGVFSVEPVPKIIAFSLDRPHQDRWRLNLATIKGIVWSSCQGSDHHIRKVSASVQTCINFGAEVSRSELSRSWGGDPRAVCTADGPRIGHVPRMAFEAKRPCQPRIERYLSHTVSPA